MDESDEILDDRYCRNVAAQEEIGIGKREGGDRDQQAPARPEDSRQLGEGLVEFAKVLDDAAGIDEVEGFVGEGHAPDAPGYELTREPPAREFGPRGAERVRGEVESDDLDPAEREIESVRRRPAAGFKEATGRLSPVSRDES